MRKLPLLLLLILIPSVLVACNPTTSWGCTSATSGVQGIQSPTHTPWQGIYGSNGYNTEINNDVVDQEGLTSQKTCGNPGDMTTDVSMNADRNGAVQSYPDIRQQNVNLPISSPLSSTVTFTNPPTGTYEYAYDLWFQNRASDIMVWVYTTVSRGTGGAPVAGNFNLDSHAVTWLQYPGSETIFKYDTNVVPGGTVTVNLHDVAAKAIALGQLSPSDSWSSVQFGEEICLVPSPSHFDVSGFTLKAAAP